MYILCMICMTDLPEPAIASLQPGTRPSITSIWKIFPAINFFNYFIQKINLSAFFYVVLVLQIERIVRNSDVSNILCRKKQGRFSGITDIDLEKI